MSDIVMLGLVVIGVFFVLFAVIIVFETLSLRKEGTLAILITLIAAVFVIERTRPGLLECTFQTLIRVVFPNSPRFMIGQ